MTGVCGQPPALNVDPPGPSFAEDAVILPTISRRQFTKAAFGAIGASAVTVVTRGFGERALALERFNFQSIWLNDPEFIGYMTAIDNGYYAAQGLGVNCMPGGPDVIPEAALLSGKADISLTNLTGAVKAWEKGARLKAIGTQYQKSQWALISLEKSSYQRAEGAGWQTVACPPLSLPTFQAMLKIAGVRTEQVRISTTRRRFRS